MKPRRQIFLAILMLLVGALVSLVLIQFPSQSDKQEETVAPPAVKIIEVTLQSQRLHVHSQGVVSAHTEINLVTEVSGHIIDISSDFVSGGFFREGDVLVTIDPADYILRVAQAQAQVKEAQHLLAREEAEAEQARDEWTRLGQGDPSPLNLRIPQLHEMRAKLAAAQAELNHANRLRVRTKIRAPFDGRVRSKNVGLGQYVAGNTVLGTLYSSNIAEVRLSLDTRDLDFVHLPDTDESIETDKMPRVLLTAHLKGKKQIWRGRIVRSEGMVDRNTGMMTLVAQIPNPFGLAYRSSASSESFQSKSSQKVALPIGLFVEAIIEGRRFDRLTILPTGALFENNRVAVLDEENRLRTRLVKLLKRENNRVIIRGGLREGERVLVAGLLQPIEGMQVTPEFVSVNDQPDN